MILRIWGRSNSINVQKVLWCVEELGWIYERQDVGGPFGYPADYGRLNPHVTVPTIMLANDVVWESNTILRFLAASADRTDLYPGHPFARSLVDRWLDWQLSALASPMREVFIPLVRTRSAKPELNLVARAVADLERAWEAVDGTLSVRKFVAGDQFTLADIALGVYWNRWCKLPLNRCSRTHLEVWGRQLEVRDGFAKHLAAPLS